MGNEKNGIVVGGEGGGEDGVYRRVLADISLAHSAIATDISELARNLDEATPAQRRARIPEIAQQLRYLGDAEHETARNLIHLSREEALSDDQKNTVITSEIPKPAMAVMSPSTEAPASPATQAFWMNLAAFIIGVACQVASVMSPSLSEAVAPIAVLLLSGANVGKVLNGSLWKHLTVFVIGVACQIFAVRVPAARGALFSAAGLLLSAADLPTILARLRGEPSKG